ncbi:unnamed protein product [Wickerhamomyces anomalus]
MELPNDIKHLYITWLEEDVLAYSLRAQKSALLYTRALEKLRNYPEPVLTPRELIRVPFIGEKIVGQMEKRLEKYCKENGYNLPIGVNSVQRASSGKRTKATLDDNPTNDTAEPKKKRAKKKVCPCEKIWWSFTANPSTNQFYSAWSSVKSLLNNELVKVEGRPAHYYLTDEGKDLAENLKFADEIVFRTDAPRPSLSSSALRNPGVGDEPIVMDTIPEVRPDMNRVIHNYNSVNYHFWEPGTYTVRFVVDNREVRSSTDRDFFHRKLQQLGVDAESRPLTVGDGLWIARNKSHQ